MVFSCIPLGSSKGPGWRERGYSVEFPGIQQEPRVGGYSKEPGWRERGYAVESPWDPARTQGGGKEGMQLNPPGIQQGPRVEGKRVFSCIPLGSTRGAGGRERGYSFESPWDPAGTRGGGKEGMQLNPPGIQQGPRVEGRRVFSCIPLGSSKGAGWRERGYSVESPWDPARTQGGG